MSKWNGNKFSVYVSEEKTVLGLLDELGSQVNHNTDNLKDKTDLFGDHKGSWQGISRPTLSEEGMRATVEKHIEDIKELNTKLNTVLNNKVYNIKAFDELKNIQFNNGDTINIIADLIADETIIIDVDIIINGMGNNIVCGVNGLNKIFILNGKKVKIKDLNINMNLKGRTAIELYCNDLIDVSNCTFTGYTMDYKSSSDNTANDSSILCSGVKGGKIENCLFYDNGYQYPNETQYLNRCITMNQSNNMRVVNNVFRNVSQCIVTADFNSLVIQGNTFDSYKDNGIYTPSGCCGAKIDNNTFINSEDEAIVISGHNVRITNNDFIECFTAIAFNGPFRHSIIQGNKHIRTDKFTTFLRVRPVATTGQLENVKIIDNMLDGKLDYHIIGLRDTINVTIANNIFKVTCDSSDKFFISSDGQPINFTIKENVFESVGSTCNVYYNINTSTPSGLFSYNTLVNTVFKWIGGNVRVEGHRIDNMLKLYEDYTSRLSCQGSPEGNIKAVKGSIITDISNGNVYTKTTETSSNTGWVKL